MLVPSSMHTDTVSSHFHIWTSLSPLSYYNGSQKTQNKQAAAVGTTRHITFTIPNTLEIIRKPGIATSQTVIMAAYNNGLMDHPNIRKKLPVRN